MFTGIIEETGILKRVERGPRSLKLAVQARTVLQDVRPGDSIAVNGVCLTVTSYTQHAFTADVMPETFFSTALAGLNIGSKVNLERAMAAGGRFGGHFVTGHVDGTGTVCLKQRMENAVYMTISVPSSLSAFLIPKGSVALDGTSLTVFGAAGGQLTVSLVPHTQQHTILPEKKIGDAVNIECDILAKYMAGLFRKGEWAEKETGMMTLLKEHDFI